MHILNTLPQRLDPGATPTFAGLLAGDGTAAAPSIAFAADSDTGFYSRSANAIGFSLGGVAQGYMVSSGSAWRIANGISSGTRLDLFDSGAISLVAAGNQNITLTPSGTGSAVFAIPGTTQSPTIGRWTDATTFGVISLNGGLASTNYMGMGGGGDTRLYFAGPGAIDFRPAYGLALSLAANGRVLVGTATDSGALLQVGTNTTTSAGGMVFGPDTFLFRTSAGRLALAHPSRPQFDLELNGVIGGSFFHSTGGVFVDAGAGYGTTFRTNGTTAALTLDSSQNATFAGNVSLAANKSILFGGGTISNIYSTVDGVIVVANNANTGFSRLQFGGTTSSFPALKRDGTAITVRLADDSGYASFAANSLSMTDGIAAPSATAGLARLYVDTADGDLKVIFGDGTIKTIATDT